MDCRRPGSFWLRRPIIWFVISNILAIGWWLRSAEGSGGLWTDPAAAWMQAIGTVDAIIAAVLLDLYRREADFLAGADKRNHRARIVLLKLQSAMAAAQLEFGEHVRVCERLIPLMEKIGEDPGNDDFWQEAVQQGKMIAGPSDWLVDQILRDLDAVDTRFSDPAFHVGSDIHLLALLYRVFCLSLQLERQTQPEGYVGVDMRSIESMLMQIHKVATSGDKAAHKLQFAIAAELRLARKDYESGVATQPG